MRIQRFFLWCFLFVQLFSVASFGKDSLQTSLNVRCGQMIDGYSSELRKDQLISIREGLITKVETYNEALSLDGDLLDLSAYTCLPGLIDTHTHITERADETNDLSIHYTRSMTEVREISEVNALITLSAGFTTVRNLGAYIAWSGRDLRDRINNGEVLGPRIQTSGFYLTVPSGGGDLVIPGIPEDVIPDRIRQGVSRGPDQFRINAVKAVKGGADVLKIIASGAVLAYGGVPGSPEMTPEEIVAVVEVAHEAGIKVTAHAHGAQSIKEAILAGVDSIEHASLADEEAIQLAAKHQVAFSMDVYNGDYINAVAAIQGWPEEFLRKNIETTDAQREVFSTAFSAGVPIIYGTDSAVYPHGDNAKQFVIMVRQGMTPMEAIQAATSVAAKFIGWQDRVGSIAVGLHGDIIAVKQDPLDNIAALQDVAVVIKNGQVVKHSKPIQD
jgi:imidazolonepropionase-like amidohydrolase